MDQTEYLSVLTQASAETVKMFVESLLDSIGEVNVVSSRTGLVMAPYKDTVQGTAFHLGEVLVAEAHVIVNETKGYGCCMGRDVEQALAIAILDAVLQSGEHTKPITAFIQSEADKLAAAEEKLLKQVEATRVEMETFL